MSSFFTSSNGSKTTPLRGLLLVCLAAQTANPFPFLPSRFLIAKEEEGEANRALRFSPCEFNRLNADAALRSILSGIFGEREREGAVRKRNAVSECVRLLEEMMYVCGTVGWGWRTVG